MAVTLYRISLPVFIKHLNGLATCMQIAQALYAGKKYDEAALLGYRFYPDMFDFTGQVQVATDHPRNFTALLADVKAPKYENHEKSLAELIARVEKTVAWLKTIEPEQIDGTEDKSVTVRRATGDVQMTGLELLLNRSMPNFLFHCTTAYDIMRHNGVEIGKRHFMGTG
ncbi:MAG TPA: DUF1993 domain-containing protein [Burkholderiales bacterium]|jgi:hypothetical protein|nr:DUF1993 domain-containing protein [Burkholderiales bacterium]